MADPGGFGSEHFGDPMGSGGPVQVLGARAIAGQLVRIALSVEPVHASASGANDALNPANYTFAVTAGSGSQPFAMSVSTNLVQGPAPVVPSGAWGVDVYVDRPLVAGLSFSVTVANVQARFGGVQGAPFSAGFVGVVKVTAVAPPPRRVDLTDVRNDAFSGTFGVDDSGDLGVQGGQDGLRKRMLRRAYTPLNAFSHLPGYGTGVRLKQPFGPAKVAEYKADLQGQLKLEPEVADADVTVTQLATGIVQILMTVRTKAGAIVQASANAPMGGVVIPS